MSDLISVLMCVYNTPVEYLSEAVDSILSQTYKNIEFIIVDDGSDELDIVNYLSEIESSSNNVKLIRNDKNLGLTQSLNIGLKQCCGKYIARMDSDDISMPERLAMQYEYMEQHEDVSLVGSNIICFGEGIENTRRNPKEVFDDPEMYRISSLFQQSGPPHPTFMFRSSFLRDKGIDYREDILKAQDYGIMVDTLMHGGGIRKIMTPLLKYRIHKDQITNGFGVEQQMYQCKVSYDYIGYLFPELSGEERAALSLLGSGKGVAGTIELVNSDGEIRSICEHLANYAEILTCSNVYIKAIRHIIGLNTTKRLYMSEKFKAVIRGKWWKLAIRTSMELRKPWGVNLYTLLSYKYSGMGEVYNG